MQLTTWRRLAALALLLAAAALAVVGCDRRASDPARPSTGSTSPGSTPGSTSGNTSGLNPGITLGTTLRTNSGTTPSSTTGSGIRAPDSLTPAMPAALAAPVGRPPP